MLRRGLAGLAVICVTGWVAAAVWFQFAGSLRLGLLLLLAGTGLYLLRRLWLGRPVLRWLGLMVLVAGLWWATIRPSDTRDWAADVARGVTATVAGDRVTLRDLRAFDWRTTEDFTPRWTTAEVDLSTLTSVDLVTSVWDSPHIAHTLLSFGFADGRQIVFSTEIRRETDEEFSSFGGFFKRFELVLVAADERDIIRLRSDVRRERVAIWPLQTTPAQRRAMFLALIDLGNSLQGHPRWYHTIWTNCTTLPWFLAHRLDAGLWPDWRVVLSGHIPDYLRDAGFIAGDMTAAMAQVVPTDGHAETGPAYSRLLRDPQRRMGQVEMPSTE